MNTTDTSNTSNMEQNHHSGNHNNNTNQKSSYPRRRSTFAVVAGIVLILMGASYVLNQFLPWIFDWLDSGLVVACVAIVVGFVLLLKKSH